MAEKDVPYFSPAQQTIGVVAAAVAMIGGILAARVIVGDSEVAPLADLIPFLVVSIAPILLVLAAWRLWYGRSNPRTSRGERKRRYLIDVLEAPYWQALTVYGSSPVMVMFAMVALHSESIGYAAKALAILLPIGILLAALTLHFVRLRAQRLLGKS